MSDKILKECPNLVAWTLSGDYDLDKPVLLDADKPDRYITRRKTHEIVAALTGAFTPDSTVCLHLPNDILYPALTLGILANGCRWTGTNTAYTAAELEHHFRISDTKYVITIGKHYEVVHRAVNASGTNAEVIRFVDLLDGPLLPARLEKGLSQSNVTNGVQRSKSEKQKRDSIICEDCAQPVPDIPEIPGGDLGTLDSKFGSLRTLRDLLCDPADVDLLSVIKNISPASDAVLMQTSGTTGLPKMAARTHRSLINEQLAIEDNNADKPYEVRRLYCTPVFHAFTLPEMGFNAMRLGQTSYFMKRYDDTFAQKIHDFQITETMGAPPMLRLLVKNPERYHLLQSLRIIFFGGAALGPELRTMTLAMFDRPLRLVPVYGMTEGGWFTTIKDPEIDDTGSVGRPIAEYEIRMSATTDSATELSDGQKVGEILVRGPQMMERYYNNSVATQDAFTPDGWLKTGDIGYLKDGKVYLVDRAKDLIKVNGWQVAPAELEDVLMRSAHVQDVAVFGVGADGDDQASDEHPMACVVARGKGVTVEMIKKHLAGCLTGYKVKHCEVRFVKSIPKSPAGKILKRVMKEKLAVGILV